MPSGGRCCTCGKVTDSYISYDGVLCSRHHAQYSSDFEDVQSWYRNQEENVRSKSEDIDNELTFSAYGHYHWSSSGTFWHDCNRCSSGFYSDDYNDSGLCVSCTELVSRLTKEREKIWRDFKETHYRKMNAVKRRYGLKELELDESSFQYYY